MGNGYQLNRPGILGVLEGWDKIILASREDMGETPSEAGSTKHKITIEELLILLRELKRSLDPNRLLRIERSIELHLRDYENPHRTTLEQLLTSVLQELYEDWLNYKNTNEHGGIIPLEELKNMYSVDVFLKVIFQFIEIADVDTALAGVSVDKITSVFDVYMMIKQHDTDLDAHSVIFESLVPGVVIDYDPSYALSASVGVPDSVNVVRNTIMKYMDSDGLYKSSPINTLPIDWSRGYPAFPIFGATTNYIYPNDAFNHANWVRMNTTVSQDANVKTPEAGSAWSIKATKDSNPIIHSISTDIRSGDIVANTRKLCASIFVRTGNCKIVGLVLRPKSSTFTEHDMARFDIENNVTFISDAADPSITFELTKTHGGWSRCTITRQVSTIVDYIFQVILLDIVDGDASYTGNTEALYLWGAQCESDTNAASPIITTSNAIATRAATIVTTGVSGWYNARNGTIVVDISNNTNMFDDRAVKSAYDFSQGASSSILMGSFPTTQQGRFLMNAASTKSSSIASQWMSATNDKWVIYAQSYSEEEHCFGSDQLIQRVPVADEVNPAVNILTIGNNRLNTAPLCGYMRQFVYYPSYANEEQHLFLTRS